MANHRAECFGTRGEQLADAAESLIGTRFRLNGRDPASGLDCVGLVAVSLKIIGINSRPPEGYRLRNPAPERWLKFAEISGLTAVGGKIAVGDIVLQKVGPAQQHLIVIHREECMIHAHAGLGRVVRQRMALPLTSIAHWRLL